MPTKKKSSTKKGAPPADVVVKVDAKLKKAYDALVAVIAQTTTKEMEDFDRRWEAAAAIVFHDPPLYVVGGHRDADEFYTKVMHEDPRNGRRYVRVAKYASPREESRYGVAKIDAALSFIEAKLGAKLEHPPLPIALAKLRIPTPDGNRSIETATFDQIKAATRKLAGETRRRRTSPTQQALKKKLESVGSLKGTEVTERSGYVSFLRVPVAALDRFARAVLATKLP